jgi:hypothetical protein
MSVDSCEGAAKTAEFADVLPCKKSSIKTVFGVDDWHDCYDTRGCDPYL